MSNWILHYKEQCRIYGEVSIEAYTEGQQKGTIHEHVSRQNPTTLQRLEPPQRFQESGWRH